jgi:hypothetical protein
MTENIVSNLKLRQQVSENIAIPTNQGLNDIPLLLEAKQLDTNKIKILFDRPVDLVSAKNISNYWLQSNQYIPTGVASLGINETPNSSNSLKRENARIESLYFTKTTLILISNRRLTTCVQYRLLPWFINADGKSGYTGPNYSDLSKNTFIAK